MEAGRCTVICYRLCSAPLRTNVPVVVRELQRTFACMRDLRQQWYHPQRLLHHFVIEGRRANSGEHHDAYLFLASLIDVVDEYLLVRSFACTTC